MFMLNLKVMPKLSLHYFMQIRETQTEPVHCEKANEVESKKFDLGDTKNEDIRYSVECFNLDTKPAGIYN